MLFKFLFMIAIVTAIAYLMVEPENKIGILQLAMVITLLVIAFSPVHQVGGVEFSTGFGGLFGGAADDLAEKKDNIPAKKDAPEDEKVNLPPPTKKRVLEEPNLQQVDNLGRSIDDKMAMNHTASKVIAPGGINDVFEERVISDKKVQVAAGYEEDSIGSPL